MEPIFGGRCPDLADPPIVVGIIDVPGTTGSADALIRRGRELVRLHADALYLDPTRSAAGAGPIDASIPSLMGAIGAECGLPIMVRARTQVDIEAAIAGAPAWIDLTAWSDAAAPDVGESATGPATLQSPHPSDWSLVGRSVVDVGVLEEPGLSERLECIAEMVAGGQDVACRMAPGSHTASTGAAALAIALRRGARMIITSDVRSARRTAQVMSCLTNAGRRR